MKYFVTEQTHNINAPRGAKIIRDLAVNALGTSELSYRKGKPRAIACQHWSGDSVKKQTPCYITHVNRVQKSTHKVSRESIFVAWQFSHFIWPQDFDWECCLKRWKRGPLNIQCLNVIVRTEVKGKSNEQYIIIRCT